MVVVAAIFAKFSRRYLHKWDSAIEGRAAEIAAEWSERLGGLTAEQVGRGLDAWSEDWPPSSEEFRKACLGRNLNEFGLNYIPEYYREQPKITDRSRILSSDARKANREKNRAHVAAMKAALRGKA